MKIDQSSGFLLDLVQQVRGGRMLPAAMQRPYVWAKTDVEALCDSILSGFPIGGFLLWSPGSKFDLTTVAKHRLGPVQAAAESNGLPYYLLLDGQNRLATIAWMMAEEYDQAPVDASEAERQTWFSGETLVLDNESKSVKFVPNAEATQGLRLPAWTLASSSTASHRKANQLVRAMWEPWKAQFPESEMESFLDFWGNACHQFKSARTSHTVIEEATPEQARHAFLRICKVGVPMSAADFDAAIGWSPGA